MLKNTFHPAQVFFILSLSFISGVFFGSFLKNPALFVILPVSFFVGYFKFFDKRKILTFCFCLVIFWGFIITGSAALQKESQILNLERFTGKQITLTAIITNSSPAGEKRLLELKPDNFSEVKFRIFVKSAPEYSTGYTINVKGILQKGNLKDSFYIDSPEIIMVKKTKNFQFYAFAAKNFLKNSLLKTLSPLQADFLTGILYGETSDQNLKQAMIKSGTSHLTAISGYNITIISSNIYRIFQSLYLPRTVIFPVTLFLIILFVVFTGAGASVVRAALIGSLILIADLTGRLPYLRNLILAAAVLMLIFNPLLLVFNLSFQLSFLAFLGIIYVGPIIYKSFMWLFKTRDFGSWSLILKPAAETLAAQIMVLPLISYSLGRVSFLGPLSNLLILPLIPLTMLLGFLTIGVSLLFLPLGLIFSPVMKSLINYHIFIINSFSRLSLNIPDFQLNLLGLIIIYAAIFTSLIIYLKNRAFDPYENLI